MHTYFIFWLGPKKSPPKERNVEVRAAKSCNIEICPTRRGGKKDAAMWYFVFILIIIALLVAIQYVQDVLQPTYKLNVTTYVHTIHTYNIYMIKKGFVSPAEQAAKLD